MANQEAGHDLLQQAAHALEAIAGGRIEALREPRPRYKGTHADAVLTFMRDGHRHELPAELKRTLPTAGLPALVQQLQLGPEPRLLVAEYVNPVQADRLRELGQPFVDAAGNAYLDFPGFFVFIKGNKPRPDRQRQAAVRVFRRTGLQVVFALLCKPELAGAGYREIADAAGVALGTVNGAMHDLREQGFLVDLGKRGRRLRNVEPLVQRWVVAFAEQLRPKQSIGRFRALDPHWWQNAALAGTGAFWGGEYAAAELTGYLKPATFTAYLTTAPNDFIQRHRLHRADDGDVELLHAFWNLPPDPAHPDLAPPLLVYADLLTTGDNRNMEVARRLYEEFIAEPR